MFANVEDFQKFGKEQFDAASRAVATFSKNAQQLAAEAQDYSKKSFEQGAAAFEKLLGARSFDKAIEIQTEYAKQAYEGYVAQAQKVGALYSSLAKDAMKPVEGAIAKDGK